METKKQKFIKIIKRIGIGLSLGFNIIFLIALIIGSSGAKKQVNCCLAESDNVVEKLDIKQDNKRYASYDSTGVVLSSYELNNYVFPNTIEFLTALQSNVFDCSYNSITSVYKTKKSTGYGWMLSSYQGSFKFPCIVLGVVDGYGVDDNKFHYYSSSTTEESFEYDLSIYDNGVWAGSLVGAIQSDIELNESTINDGIFETLTDSVTAFVGSIGSGIVAMTSVFYDSANSQLTTIGLLSVIVVAVSLCYFLFRLLFGLIRMRG